MVTSTEHASKLVGILDSVGITVYAQPATPEDTVVCLGRLRPLTEGDTNLKMAESRLLKFISAALLVASENKAWQLRFSRPWVLKDNKLAFTWDFTIRGDLTVALNSLSEIKIPGIVMREEVSVPVRPIKTKRGKVSAVRAA